MIDFKEILSITAQLRKKYDISYDFSDSSSIHRINGDRPIDQQAAVFYFLLNEINNTINSAENTSLRYSDFLLTTDRYLELWDMLVEDDSTPSPSRLLSDMFWAQLPWSDIHSQLGDVNVVDIGCGKGGYSKRVVEFSNGLVSSYHGLDISSHSDWEKNISWAKDAAANISFETIDIDSNVATFDKHIPEGTNFFMSQSCLEHLEKDVSLLKSIKRYIAKTGKKCIQVHLVPAPASLELYLLHGYRQYGHNAVAKLTRMFVDDEYDVEVHRLCGRMCKDLHREYITNPIYLDGKGDYRDLMPQDYRAKLKQAAFLDMQSPIEDPTFLAIVIKNF